MVKHGLITVESRFGVTETIDRLTEAVEHAGLLVFARVDHAAGARKVGASLRPTELLIFGNPTGGTLGATGGSQTHTLTTPEIPAHSHGVTDPGHQHQVPTSIGLGGTGSGDVVQTASTNVSGSAATGISIDNAGGGGAHRNVQPTIVLNYIISTGGV